MRYLSIFIVLVFLSPSETFGYADVSITVNDHLSCSGQFYTGMLNYINIRISNSDRIQAAAMAFEFSDYPVPVVWRTVQGSCYPECIVASGCRSEGVWTLPQLLQNSHLDGVLPDQVLFGGVTMPGQGLPPGNDITYQIAVYIPANGPAGQFCIDNVFYPPAGTWEFNEGSFGYAPTFQGQPNVSIVDPDAPRVCFNVVQRRCGDLNLDGLVDWTDYHKLVSFIHGIGGAVCPLKFADINGDCAVGSADSARFYNHLTNGNSTPLCSCEENVPPCSDCSGQKPGDVNNDGQIAQTDLSFLVAFLCAGGPSPAVIANADVNGDCQIDSVDIVRLASYLNAGFPPPVECTCDNPELVGCTVPSGVCEHSYADPVFLVCPGGDAAFNVWLRDYYGQPIVGDTSTYIEFVSSCTGISSCEATPPTILHALSPSDAEGRVTFVFEGGGCNDACRALVMANCGVITSVPVRSFDTDGNDSVSLTRDFVFSECNNYDAVAGIQYADQEAFNLHCGHHCGMGAGERFSAEFVLDPAQDLNPGQSVLLKLRLQNNNPTSCFVGFVGFFASGFGTGGGETLIQNYPYNGNLAAGGKDSITISYVVPGAGHGCLRTRFIATCCDTAISLERCLISRQLCGQMAGLCYEFFVRILDRPIYGVVIQDDFLPTGWYLSDISIPGGNPILPPATVSFKICSPLDVELGDMATVPVQLWTDASHVLPPIIPVAKVFITPRTGDIDGNCLVSVSDVVYLINYIFAGGPPPHPCQAGDVDCSGICNISDAVYLINYIFIGGPPPCIPGAATPEPNCGD